MEDKTKEIVGKFAGAIVGADVNDVLFAFRTILTRIAFHLYETQNGTKEEGEQIRESICNYLKNLTKEIKDYDTEN